MTASEAEDYVTKAYGRLEGYASSPLGRMPLALSTETQVQRKGALMTRPAEPPVGSVVLAGSRLQGRHPRAYERMFEGWCVAGGSCMYEWGGVPDPIKVLHVPVNPEPNHDCLLRTASMGETWTWALDCLAWRSSADGSLAHWKHLASEAGLTIWQQVDQ